MGRHDAYNSECLVFVYKEGLLSKLAHDLKLQLERFSIEYDEQKRQVTATFDPSSFQVVCAMAEGKDDPSALSSGDKKKILSNISRDVLHVRKHPEIRFESSDVIPRGDGFVVEGRLSLHGATRSMRADVKRHGDRWATEIRLHQPDFGIKPYSAALGALRIKPDVKVSISAPRD